MLKIAGLALCVLTLMGCASTPQDLRSNQSLKRVFSVQTGYQVALKRIVDYNTECVVGSFVHAGGYGINEVRNYPDLRTASIVRGNAVLIPEILQILDFRELSPGVTEVTVYASFRTDFTAAVYKRVAEGVVTTAKCAR